MNRFHLTKGFSLPEMIIYLAVLTILTTAIVGALLGLSSTYRQLRAVKHIERSGILSMERMTREIKNATTIDVGQSVLGSGPGTLTLNATTLGGNARVVKFYVENGTLKVSQNGALEGPLSSKKASTTNLVFYRISTPNSEAVRIVLTLSATSSNYARTERFYGTAILRGSY